jgi:Protein of unknown function (DUF3592)
MIEALFLIVIGPIALFGGILLLNGQLGLSRRGVITKGKPTTIDLADTEGGEHVGVGYANVIQFTTEEGVQFQFRSTMASQKNIAEQRPIEVIYLPERPDSATVNSFTHRWALTISLTVIGIVCSVYAVQYFFIT